MQTIQVLTLAFCSALHLLACSSDDGAPAPSDAGGGYEYQLSIKVDDNPSNLEIQVAGVPLSSTTNSGVLTFSFSRLFSDRSEATGRLEAKVRIDGETVNTLEPLLNPCTTTNAPSCTLVDRAERTICLFANGDTKLACGRLDCFLGNNRCGGFVE